MAKALQQQDKTTRDDRWLGIMACTAIVWYIMGTLVFFLSLKTTPEALFDIGASDRQIQYITTMSIWVKLAYAVTLFTGLAGSIALLNRSKTAYILYMISVFGILSQMADSILRGGIDVVGVASNGISISVIIFGLFLFWLTYSAMQDGHLR